MINIGYVQIRILDKLFFNHMYKKINIKIVYIKIATYLNLHINNLNIILNIQIFKNVLKNNKTYQIIY